MLPRVLCEDLCSLNPNTERLAFSVLFHINKEGNLIKQEQTIFQKSVIKSKYKLSYDLVNLILEGQVTNKE